MTFYTLAKVNPLCGPIDHRIGVSKVWSYVNIIISTIAYSAGLYWLSISNRLFRYNAYDNIARYILIMGVPLYAIGVLLTIIFLHYDSLCCCCCDCCLGEEQVVIHDPSNPEANLVWRDRQAENYNHFSLSLFLYSGC